MKRDLYEIIEKPHKGEMKFWIQDELCILNGPYDTIEEAEADTPKGDLQYPLVMTPFGLMRNQSK
jgi:hypothetical protein